MYDSRNYLIIPTEEVSKVDFTQVCETSAETLRKSVDETKTFIKWDGEAPEFVATIVGAQGPYTYAEILEILSTPEWTAPIESIEPASEEPVMVRARDEDGRFIADDPSTPDVNEAWTVVEEV